MDSAGSGWTASPNSWPRCATTQKRVRLTIKRKVEELEQPHPLQVEVLAEVLFPIAANFEVVRLDVPTTDQLDKLRSEIQVRLAVSNPAYAGVDEIARYNATVPGHASRLAGYLAQRAVWEAIAETGIYAQLMVINRTKYPVEHAVLELRAPEHVTFRFPLPRPEPPQALPRPEGLPIGSQPKNARTSALWAMIGAASALSPSLSPSLSIAAIRGVKPIQQRGPWVRREESWIQCKLDEPLRPDHEEFAGKIWIAIRPEFPDEDLRIGLASLRAVPIALGTHATVQHRP